MKFIYPQFNRHISVLLFENVTNASEIRQGLISGDEKFEFAFVDPSNIVSIEQLKLAIYRALNDAESGHMRTKSIHGEILFCFSPVNNIMDAFRRFGINDHTCAFFAIKVADNIDNLEESENFIRDKVTGHEIDVELYVNKHTNLGLVKKVSKNRILLYT